MSAKNELQEYYQKRSLPLPQYSQERKSGMDHEPIWVSTVTLADQRVLISDERTSKKAADLNAAEKALDLLRSEPKEEIRSDPRTVILVDLENCPGFIKELHVQMNVVVFVGQYHPLAERDLPYDWIRKIVVPGSRTDLVDSFIQVYVGSCLAQERYDQYIIVTRDHFAFSLLDVIRSSDGGWIPKDGKVITKISDL